MAYLPGGCTCEFFEVARFPPQLHTALNHLDSHIDIWGAIEPVKNLLACGAPSFQHIWDGRDIALPFKKTGTLLSPAVAGYSSGGKVYSILFPTASFGKISGELGVRITTRLQSVVGHTPPDAEAIQRNTNCKSLRSFQFLLVCRDSNHCARIHHICSRASSATR